jgi:hypothetical protein
MTNSLVGSRRDQFIDITPEPLDTEETTIMINQFSRQLGRGLNRLPPNRYH